MPKLNKTIKNASAKSSDIYIHPCRFLIFDNPLNPTDRFHCVDAAPSFCFQNATSFAPSDGRAVCTAAGRINTNNQWPVSFNLFAPCLQDNLGRNEAIEVG